MIIAVFDINQIKSNLFVTQNYTIPIKDGKIEQCVNRTQRQLRATLTGAQTVSRCRYHIMKYKQQFYYGRPA